VSANQEFLFEGRKWKIMLLCRDYEIVGGSDYMFDLLKVTRVISGNVE
jgi:hypothetical protein